MYDPKTNKFPYPLDTACHYLGVKKDNGNVYDENYKYIDDSKRFKFIQFLSRIVLVLIVWPFQWMRMGLKIKGRKNIRKNKKLLKQGAISVSNHVHMWDFAAIMKALYPRKPNILAWDKNISGENSKVIRIVGGIPVPTKNMRGFVAFMKAIIKKIQDGGWLHICAEGSMWEYYAPIRPFKEGASYFAYKSDKPIVPMAFSYRPVGWIRKHIFHQIALFSLNIGDPLFIDKSLPKDKAIEKLTIETHEAVCALAGFKKGENIYPPLYNKDSSKRIDYYTSEYGIGYKGSW